MAAPSAARADLPRISYPPVSVPVAAVRRKSDLLSGPSADWLSGFAHSGASERECRRGLRKPLPDHDVSAPGLVRLATRGLCGFARRPAVGSGPDGAPAVHIDPPLFRRYGFRPELGARKGA